MKYICITVVACLLIGCQSDPAWQHTSTIALDGVNPIGMALLDNQLWISDSDHNQVVSVDSKGEVIDRKTEFERPMHIASDGNNLLVPEYGNDQITILSNPRSALGLLDSLDAPAGVDSHDGQYAIVDFYNHRVLYGSGDNWISFGKEGNARGQLYFPTDVQIYEDEIFVADAYNNRVQVFDTQGKYQRLFGVNEEMNAATGLFVHDGEVFVTDFENDRVIVYTTDGVLLQIIDEGLSKPTDFIFYDNQLYVCNYKGENLMTFSKS